MFISVKKIHHQKENFSLYNFYIKHFFIKSFLFRVNSVKNTLIQFKNSSGMKKYKCFLVFSLKCHKKVIFFHISKKNTSPEREFFTLQLLYKAFFHKIIPFQSKFSLKIPCFNFGNAKKKSGIGGHTRNRNSGRSRVNSPQSRQSP